MMTPAAQDWPARLLAAAARVMPAGRGDWGRAMQAELAAIGDRPERWSFAWGCVRGAAAELHLLRAVVHLIVVLGTLFALLAWTITVDYPPLAWILFVVVSVLVGVCWEARRAGMLGVLGDSATAWLLRGCGYLIAGAVAAVAVAHAHPATVETADPGTGVLVFATVPASYLIGLAMVCAQRSAATGRVMITGAGAGAGAGLAGAAVWLVVVLVAGGIPTAAGLTLILTVAAAGAAVLANSGRAGFTRDGLLSGLLATVTTMALIFAAVVVLAHWGPDRLIPNITPHALPGARIAESRIEIVDPYVGILVLSGLMATLLSIVAVITRPPLPGRPGLGGGGPRIALDGPLG